MNNLLKILSIVCFCLIENYVFAQNILPQNYFASPLEIPLELSGTFGELRYNHFHSGIDIKTQEREGFNVYASADGWISRIKVSAYGFGKVIYINHPNGYTTVYAHLLKFNNKINNYVESIQFQKESFEIDKILPPNKIKVKKGETIAFSGNSGGSEGPHLHFEIRNTKTEFPINPLLFNFKIDDTIPPVIQDVVCLNEKFEIIKTDFYKKSDTLFLPKKFAVGIAVYDEMNCVNSKNGIYKIQIFQDSILFYKATLNTFSFNESRYVNAFINYNLLINKNIRYIQTCILPGNLLNIYNYFRNNGFVENYDNKIHSIQFEIFDFNGNIKKYNFYYRLENNKDTISNILVDSGFLINYTKNIKYTSEKLLISFPAFSLYDNLKLVIKEYEKTDSDYLSNIYEIHRNTVPLHKNIEISIKADSVNENLRNKLLIVSIDENGKNTSEGGKYIDGFVKTNINNFGKFAVLIDTIAPFIKPLNYIKKTLSVNQKTLDFEISDDLSGVAKYKAFLNGKWILMEFDGKTNKLTYTIDDNLVIGSNTLIIEAEDKCHNCNKINLLIFK